MPSADFVIDRDVDGVRGVRIHVRQVTDQVARARQRLATGRDAGFELHALRGGKIAAGNHGVRIVEYELGDVAGARLFADDYRGHAQMVVDEDRKTIVGMTLAGPGVGEIIHAATIAVAGEVTLDRLWHAVPSYPTISEVWLRLLETYGL